MAKWFWGLLILAIAALLLSLYGPYNAKSRSVEMGQSIETALQNAGYGDMVSVNMVGNVATLSGEVPDSETAQEIESVAASTECNVCKKDGKVWHDVVNHLTIAAAPDVETSADVSPYTFTAVKSSEGGLSVSGYVRNDNELARVMREAQSLFPMGVEDGGLSVASGAPNGQWGNSISTLLSGLALLDSGKVSMENRTALISGQTEDVSVRERINGDIQSLPGGFEGATYITVPDQAADNVGEVRSESLCQTLLNDLKSDGRVNFATNKAEIAGAESFDLLNALSSATKQCSSFKLRIEGHTDSVGDDAYNQSLSESRAISVKNYLVDTGIDLDRITAVGFGETKPIADNSTPDGQAANRRIDFIITTSE